MTDMSGFSTPAIILRRIEHGDYDLILTLMTLDQGKVTVIAKHARKSVKRFSGILELFALLRVVCTKGRGALPVLQEAALEHSHYHIRKEIKKTAYASYWAEMVNEWLEERKKQDDIFYILRQALGAIESTSMSDDLASIFFQTRFLKAAGLSPRLGECHICKTDLDGIPGKTLGIDLPGGGIVCSKCGSPHKIQKRILKGTVKQLLWVSRENETTAKRIQFSPQALNNGLDFLDSFVSYHLGKDLKSLKFLKDMRHSNYGKNR